MNITILIPCHNEEASIGIVVNEYQKMVPDARIVVCDNASTDATKVKAQEAGAFVISEFHKGKGNAMRRVFADIDADIYVMVDGDGTYDVEALPEMISSLVSNNLDMVIGVRKEEEGQKTYRSGHRTGNRVFNKIVATLFGKGFQDIFSGYRVMSRRFVKSFPVLSNGFEIETEMAIHILRLKLPYLEVSTRYSQRIEGTQSKLSTYKDGIRILKFIVFYFKEIRPFEFFGLIALTLAVLSLTIGVPVVMEYFETGLVERFPLAFLSMGIMLSGILSLAVGVVLDGVSRSRLETKILNYLQIPFLPDGKGK